MTYYVDLWWMLWCFLNDQEEEPSESVCNAEVLGLLLYDICP